MIFKILKYFDLSLIFFVSKQEVFILRGEKKNLTQRFKKIESKFGENMTDRVSAVQFHTFSERFNNIGLILIRVEFN